MHKILMLNLLALFTVVLVSGGCSNEPCDEMTLASEVETALERAIKTEREQFRSLPGRTGILAEERQYSVFAEELIIRDFFQDRKGGFFVDVGCAWPITGSNTYYFEKHLGWTGIGIDALDKDIEGHEPKALAGLDIERFQPELLVIEGHSREVETFYSNHGYEQIRRYIPFDHVNRYCRRKQIAAPSGA